MTYRTFLHLMLALVLLAGSIVLNFYLYANIESLSKRLGELHYQKAQKVSPKPLSEGERRTFAESKIAIAARRIHPLEIVPFLDGLVRAGTALGAHVEVTSVDAAARNGRISFTLSVVGSFDSVLRTIGALEFGPHDLLLQGATLSQSTLPSGESTWTASANFEIGTL